MKARDFIVESKKIEPSRPRNFVAKNMNKASGGAGPHKDKKKAAKQGNVKHKNKEMAEASEGNKIEKLEALINELEQLMPAVTTAQKNHYEFEEMEAEVGAIAEAAKSLSDRSAIVDITDSVEEAIQYMRQANGAIYNIEKTLKGLIKSANYALDDARDEEQYESRFGSSESIEEADKKSTMQERLTKKSK